MVRVAARFGNDRLDEFSFCGGISIHMGPVASRQLSLQCFVTFAVVLVSTEVITKIQVASDFLRTSAEDMHMRVPLGSAEHAVLIKVRFAHAQDVAGEFQRREIVFFVRGIPYYQQDIDNRFGAEAGDRGGTDVLDPQGGTANCLMNPPRMLLIFDRPLWIIIRNYNRSFLGAADQTFWEIVISHKNARERAK